MLPESSGQAAPFEVQLSQIGRKIERRPRSGLGQRGAGRVSESFNCRVQISLDAKLDSQGSEKNRDILRLS